jgi:hypothetical protein
LLLPEADAAGYRPAVREPATAGLPLIERAAALAEQAAQDLRPTVAAHRIDAARLYPEAKRQFEKDLARVNGDFTEQLLKRRRAIFRVDSFPPCLTPLVQRHILSGTPLVEIDTILVIALLEMPGPNGDRVIERFHDSSAGAKEAEQLESQYRGISTYLRHDNKADVTRFISDVEKRVRHPLTFCEKVHVKYLLLKASGLGPNTGRLTKQASDWDVDAAVRQLENLFPPVSEPGKK